MKKIFFFVITAVVLIPTVTFAQQYLVGLPIDTKGSFNEYINLLYKMSISIAALLAVVKIIIAGAKYMLSDIVTNKSDAKKDIRGALLGLLLIIGAVIILETVNPALTDGGLNIRKITVPPLNITAPVQPSVNQSAIDAASFDAAATDAASTVSKGGCNVEFISEKGDFIYKTLDLSGCDKAYPTYVADFQSKCSSGGGAPQVAKDGKSPVCVTPKPEIVKSVYGEVLQQKGTVIWNVTFTDSAKVSTSNQSGLVSKCVSDMRGSVQILNGGTVSEQVKCTYPALIGYNNTSSSGLTPQTDCKEKKGSLVSGAWYSSFGADYDHYCIIK